ncbi:signal transduction protein [Alcanivorax nanhaiticus]|uniref:Signal transduction protein n=1 Tax=Alcanivorax nanhaiticus TaxID=1177154 RepID=A0A095SKG9_9GAMM|nr:EAL domain-containing protein [Alcanivorax nanhaiticus]KGD65131.1 signal transduction protein [Alcanivorax nanhaiticus]
MGIVGILAIAAAVLLLLWFCRAWWRRRDSADDAGYRLAVHHTGVGMAMLSAKGDWQHCNPAMSRLCDQPRAQLFQRPFTDLFYPEDIAGLVLPEPGCSVSLNLRLRAGEQPRWVRLTLTGIAEGKGRLLMELESTQAAHDARTELINQQQRLARESEHLRVTLDAIADAVITTDACGAITFMNPMAEALTGWTDQNAVGRPVDEVLVLVEDATGARLPSPVNEALQGIHVCFLREGSRLRSRDGSSYEIQDTASPLTADDGRLVGAVVVFRDVSSHKAMEKALDYQATHDALTGLTNRAGFELALKRALSDERQESAILCFINLDRFKVVNDTAGHIAGDALLRECAGVIGRQIRDNDVLARLGGDEFGLLLRQCPLGRARNIAERLIDALNAIRFDWESAVYDIGASVGLVELDAQVTTVEEAMSRADVACYAAKHRGRGQVMEYTAEDSDASRRHLELQMVASLRESLEANRFVLYAQEIRAMATEDEPGHYEVLLRLRGRDGEIISPGAFIPAAERYQMMPHIDRWVLRQLLLERGEELAGITGLNLAINLSATTLDDPGFLSYLERLLAETPLEAQRLTFEITETTVVNQMGSVSEVLIWLRDQGCKVALDDFGSGFSSFNYLKHFKVDYLKIDGSFVRNLVRSSVDHTIVESINEVAHRLGIQTVAEYVEDEALIPLLRETGVDFVQGYAIGLPEPLDALFKRHRQPRVSNAHPPLH